jgi:hypothetical protein
MESKKVIYHHLQITILIRLFQSFKSIKKFNEINTRCRYYVSVSTTTKVLFKIRLNYTFL